jgi:adenosylcobyric acid synthase
VILPGTKATLADLAFLRAQGWDIDLLGHVRRGGRVLGVCGGFQMLGRRVADPDGVEGPPAEAVGLGLLDIDTVLTGEKLLRPVAGDLQGAAFTGYEMHVGRTTGAGLARPLLRFADGGQDGAVSADGRIGGAYVHGLFATAAARGAVLSDLGATSVIGDYDLVVDRALDELAAALETAFDVTALSRLAGVSAA